MLAAVIAQLAKKRVRSVSMQIPVGLSQVSRVQITVMHVSCATRIAHDAPRYASGLHPGTCTRLAKTPKDSVDACVSRRMGIQTLPQTYWLQNGR